jgi:uncharacterized protein (TIGR00369 family)
LRTYLPTYDPCYVCGQKNPHGLKMHYFIEGEAVKAEFTPMEHQLGYPGVVHGGVICAILDEIMGWPLSVKTGRMSVTARLQIRFVRPVTIGQTYTISAYAVDTERRPWKARGEIRDQEGQLYVRANGVYMPFSREQTQEMGRHLTYQPGDRRVFTPGA